MWSRTKRFFRDLRKPGLPSAASLRRAHDVMARTALAEANAARDAALWRDAADRYANYLRLRPDDAPIHTQHGNMLRQAGDLTGAEAAYRTALKIKPTGDLWLQLGRALSEQGRADDAVSALIEGLRLEPELYGARDELIKLDARILAPRGRYDDWPTHDLRSGRTLRPDAQRWRASGSYPAGAWDAFRRDTPLESPPVRASAATRIIVDATDAGPARLRATLVSLRAQSLTSWTCSVVGPVGQADHSVGSFADIDARIRFTSDAEEIGQDGSLVLSLAAGVVLAPLALEWFVFAQRRTGATVVYADHDHHIDHWRDGPRHIDPVLHPLPDVIDLETTRLPPQVLLLAPSSIQACPGHRQYRDIVIQAIRDRTVAHVPRLLSSVADLPAVADRGASDPREDAPGWLQVSPSLPEPRGRTWDDETTLLVVMPTRDQAALLQTSIRSLYATATRPDRLSVLIIDNRSREVETAEVIAELCQNPRIRALAVDSPFNWSRCNNLGAAAADSDSLLFLNNDTEMLTDGWDAIVRMHLADRNTGVVGARLLYPDRTLQHVGMICGLGRGAPMHEGVGEPRDAGGPGGRWQRDRCASAVTGAFMAVRRDVFEQVGGFDQDALMIGYNDVDFCFRVRAVGLAVVLAADVEMIHHESKTRGLNDTRGRAAWDQGELKSLHATWGRGLLHDPGLNPHWDRTVDTPFAAYREPDMAAVLDWIDVSAGGDPWRPEPPGRRLD